ncbi:hypothetical protein [Candidatus Nephthysia bennettiae]|uniref:hypothetical protein n=1 Tax=Candidatus Nephthysia bennettiae TaxID=3127016 RepID=UPI0030C6979A
MLVGGPPASGKSSLAAPLAVELELPLIAKDAIKEALMDVLGLPGDVEESRRLGRAAVMAMLTIARTSPGGVLDSTWYPYARPALAELRGPLVEVRCVVPLGGGAQSLRGAREVPARRPPGRRPGGG